MPRGRPRKIPVEPIVEDSIEWEVAKILVGYCNIPGCSPKLHIDEAKQLVSIMRRRFNLVESDN